MTGVRPAEQPPPGRRWRGLLALLAGPLVLWAGCQNKPADPEPQAGKEATKHQDPKPQAGKDPAGHPGPADPKALANWLRRLTGGGTPPAGDTDREKKESARRLKELALAMHRYHDAHHKLPPAVYLRPGALPGFAGLLLPGDDIPRFEAKVLKGKRLPIFSWRVELLPFLGQEDLYKAFHFTEPWNSPHNKKLLARMPKVYAPVRGKTREPYSTYYQVFASGAINSMDTPFNGMLSSRIPASFPDGLANTFLIAEAGEAVPWTKPEDIPYAHTKPVPKLGGLFPDGFHAAFADTSVRFIPRDTDEKTLQLLIVPNDGQPVVLPGNEVKVDVERPGPDRTGPKAP
jgi:hypothetical protein